MQTRKEIALLIETSNAYARGLVEGIIAYMREHEPWSIYLPEQGRGAAPPTWLKNWKGDGLIARIETKEIGSIIQKTHLPVVDVSAGQFVKNIPWVETDDAAIADLAVNHLIERGFRHLAFCDEPEFNWSVWRRDRFQLRVTEAGIECHLFSAKPRSAPGFSWNREKKRLVRWIEQLPKPVGIMACYDIKAQQILDICRELEISVPQQVAVIGVDNDHLLCNLCSPPLSSVIPDTRRTGYEAAQLLDRLMNGEQVDSSGFLVEPLGIATRQSSDVLATDDQEIAQAMQFIREHACDGINVGDVLGVVPLSRRVLEYRFKNITGRTPHDAIVQHRLDRVRQLLQDTDLTMAEIADKAGFEHVEYMSAAFRKKLGIAPSNYRKKVQPK
ncbi:MAG: XylR family transcriptional regulator [Blastopirellula sp.]|nr:MAG: XylR family transcriptional regulator [Blastopirellula sp.]